MFGNLSGCTSSFGETQALQLLDRYVMEGEVAFGDAYFEHELRDLELAPGAQQMWIAISP